MRTLPALVFALLSVAFAANCPSLHRTWTPTLPRGPEFVDQPNYRDLRFHVVAAPSASTEATTRFARDCNVQNLACRTLDSDATNIKTLADELAQLPAGPNDIVLFIADKQAVIAAEERELGRSFTDAVDGARVLLPLGADGTPTFEALAGHVDAVRALVAQLLDAEDPAAALDTLYANTATRAKFSLTMDLKRALFASLAESDGMLDDGEFTLEMNFHDNDDPRARATSTDRYPGVFLPGDNQQLLLQIANYIPLRFTAGKGCVECAERQCASSAPTTPAVVVAVLVHDPSPFLPQFLANLERLNYPAKSMHVIVYAPKTLAATAAQWLARQTGYATAAMSNATSEMAARAAVLTLAHTLNAHVLTLSSLVRFDQPDVIQALVAEQRSAVSPLLPYPTGAAANFWPAFTRSEQEPECFDDKEQCNDWADRGECVNNSPWMLRHCPAACGNCFPHAHIAGQTYRRTLDTFDIIGNAPATWNMPFVFGATLYDRSAVEVLRAAAATVTDAPASTMELDFLFSTWLRNAAIWPAIAANRTMGRMITLVDLPDNKAHPELFLYFSNPAEWQARYLSPLYPRYKELGATPACPDVYRVPLFTSEFCHDLIEECENNGDWSGGNYQDERIQGGYEPVPTRDLHFKQIGFYNIWKSFIRQFVRPVTSHHFTGYYLDGEQTLDFVVKYSVDGQTFLRPHHDASTVTLNLALNQGGVDFQGGGTHFVRQNCTQKDITPGWGLLFPGRLTHYHEGLKITSGLRYILVSFIDQ